MLSRLGLANYPGFTADYCPDFHFIPRRRQGVQFSSGRVPDSRSSLSLTATSRAISNTPVITGSSTGNDRARDFSREEFMKRRDIVMLGALFGATFVEAATHSQGGT